MEKETESNRGPKEINCRLQFPNVHISQRLGVPCYQSRLGSCLVSEYSVIVPMSQVP